MTAPDPPDDARPRVAALLDRTLWRRILGFIRPYRRLVGWSVLLLVVLTPLQVLTPWLVKQTVDGPVAFFAWGRSTDEFEARRAAPDADPATVARDERAFFEQRFALYVAAMAAVLMVRAGARAVQMVCINVAGQRAMHDLRSAVYGHVQRLPLAYYERTPVGTLVTRVTSDVDAMNEFFTSGVDVLCYDVVAIVVILGALCWLDVELALAALAVLPALAAVSFWFRRRARAAFREVRGQVARLMAFLQESLAGMRIIQVFGQQERKRAEFARRNSDHRRAQVETMYNFAVFFPLVEFLASLSVGAVLWFGGRQVLATELSLGGFLMFWLLVQQLFHPIRELAEKYNILQGALAASERVFHVLDEQNPIAARTGAARLAPARLAGRIEFRDVIFAYTAGHPVLHGLTCAIAPGETVALVGATGAGKSTFIKLVTRLYDVTAGAVRVDGRDVRDYDPAALRRRIGVVLQDVVLFHGSVRDNLRLFEPALADARLEQAARTVGAHDFIMRLPRGYDEPVMEGGATLSAGQRQLLAFARTLAFDPDVLVLDEATANIDTETEQVIQQALATLIAGRTSIIIAHRLSTIERADRILVFEAGRIVEAGTHRELLARGGRYEALSRLQVLAPNDGGRRKAAGGSEEKDSRTDVLLPTSDC